MESVAEHFHGLQVDGGIGGVETGSNTAFGFVGVQPVVEYGFDQGCRRDKGNQ